MDTCNRCGGGLDTAGYCMECSGDGKTSYLREVCLICGHDRGKHRAKTYQCPAIAEKHEGYYDTVFSAVASEPTLAERVRALELEVNMLKAQVGRDTEDVVSGYSN